MNTQPAVNCTPADSCAVGIVWGVRDGSGPRQLVIDSTPLVEAEPYGDFLTHPRGHYEVWEGWRRLGLSGLASRRLPTVIAWHEYEHFPRGRVVFDTRLRRFTLYADRKLQGPAMLVRMLSLFGLDPRALRHALRPALPHSAR